MRFLSWIGGLLVAGTLAVGIVSAVHLHSASGHNLTASRQPASLFSANDPAVPDPPHKILPPSPSPDPPPPPPPPAPAPPARTAATLRPNSAKRGLEPAS